MKETLSGSKTRSLECQKLYAHLSLQFRSQDPRDLKGVWREYGSCQDKAHRSHCLYLDLSLIHTLAYMYFLP